MGKPGKSEAKTVNVASRVQRHRDKLRAAGLRPVQMWVYDTSRPGFAKECRRQSRLIAHDPHEQEVMDWIEKVVDTTGWK